jgi:hypothetical protein
MQARYFSAQQGRFASVDPANAGASLGDPQSWNAYAYVSNNPLTYTDPDGLGIFGDIGSIVGSLFPGLGTLIGWGVGSIADLATGQSISPPGLVGIGSDVFGGIMGSVNNGQPWNEQLPIGGGFGGGLNTGSVFGSGNTGPFIFSLENQATIGPVVLPLGNYPLLGPMVGWGKSAVYNFVDLLSLGRPTYVGQRVMDAMQPRTQQEQRGWNASQLYAAFALIPTRSADSYLTGTLKRSPSYASEYGMKTIQDLEDLAKVGNQKAQKMLKLVKQAARLQGKVGGKP